MSWTMMLQRWCSRGRKAMPSLCLAVATVVLAANANAAPSWPAAPYTYFAADESLESVLRRFASGFSLALQLAPGVAGLVNGKFTAASPTEFMDKMAGVYGFNWFVYAGTLFVSPASAMVTKTISVGNGAIAGLRDALDRLGVIDDRFGWGELPDQGLALVSGPPAYVALIERTINALPPTAGRQEVAVFRLKYASVNDRVVRYRDQSITTPGLATLLRELIAGSGPGAGNSVLSAMAAPLRDPYALREPGAAGTSPLTGIGKPAQPARGGSLDGGRRARQATIQADARLNAVIVQDIPERMAVYRSLIAQLDVPTTLIEIEVMIVDISADATKELGVRWGARAGKTEFGMGYSGPRANNPDGRGLDRGIMPPGTIGLSVADSLLARLNALQHDNEAQILSKPSILTSDNMGALIDHSKTFYIRLATDRYVDARAVTVGTSLRVTPRYIDANGARQVELTVDIEDGKITQDAEVDQLPVTSKTSVSTLAVVADGEALLIGGYNISEDGDEVSKIPLLGDIPGLGAFFSHKKKSSKRWERIFVIRPRVVEVNGAPLIPASLRKWGEAVNWSWEGGSRSTVYADGMDRTLQLSQPGPTQVLKVPAVK
ncbi:EscC/YscC/HrcC family type III secretion system outer membrane ring protein [Bordetella genomosp. 9]|uniref:Type 3 secretion system secretin n=2 Tax=Bordetella genomosp. 9 TaxID=1416803 RepID=A0A261R6P4_9BORD|nr:EscC/YscC/HrcC family type III secretion system outer membrane ring protein [Bordetella genomosp. 9]